MIARVVRLLQWLGIWPRPGHPVLLVGLLLLLGGCSVCILLRPPPATEPQRIAQGIARTMEDCLCFGYGQQGGAAALECTCRAEHECVYAGLAKRCAMDDQVMETKCYHPPVVGSCE